MKLDETFKIYKHHNLSGEDYEVLSLYYLPLISPDAFSLYLFSYMLTPQKEYSVRQTLDCVGLENEQAFNRALSRLEATGLCKSYYSETKGWLCEILTPLSSTSFLDNPLLSKALKLAIGEDSVDSLKKSHKALSLKDYQETSKAFNDVFDIKLDNLISEKISKRQKKEHLVLNDNAFNYIGFKNSFDETVIDSRIFDDPDMEKAILEIAYTYNLNEDNMRDCVYRVINFDKDISINLIEKQASRMYQELGLNKEMPQEEAAEHISESEENSDDVSQKIIKWLNSMTPEGLLKSLNNDHNVSVQELKDMAKLREAFPFTQGMINAMYLLIFNQINAVPNYNYMEKVANEWLRQNINSIEDAFNYYNNRNSTKYNKPKKHVVEPTWLKEQEEEPKQDNSDLTSEEIEAILAKRRSRK